MLLAAVDHLLDKPGRSSHVVQERSEVAGGDVLARGMAQREHGRRSGAREGWHRGEHAFENLGAQVPPCAALAGNELHVFLLFLTNARG